MKYAIRLLGLLCLVAGMAWLSLGARAAPDDPTMVVKTCPIPIRMCGRLASIN